MINPVMGILAAFSKTSLADALFPTVRQRVLAVLFGAPDRSFYGNEVIALARSGTGAVQRELKSLSSAGLLSVKKIGHQTHYQANETSPIFAELRAIVLKTSGMADVICRALLQLRTSITLAFVYGSTARGDDTGRSDIDLVVVSDALSYGEIYNALEEVDVLLNRRINPTIFTSQELAKRISQDGNFIKKVLNGPKIWLIGSELELNRLLDDLIAATQKVAFALS
jgi:predicted nucleotidyltransferase